jgi:hypothetical protein
VVLQRDDFWLNKSSRELYSSTNGGRGSWTYDLFLVLAAHHDLERSSGDGHCNGFASSHGTHIDLTK